MDYKICMRCGVWFNPSEVADGGVVYYEGHDIGEVCKDCKPTIYEGIKLF